MQSLASRGYPQLTISTNQLHRGLASSNGNPYLESIARETSFEPGQGWKNRHVGDESLRRHLARTYAWAIPNEQAIDHLVANSPVVEIGAGSGYWSWLINSHGGSAVAVDPEPYEPMWADVTRATHEVLESRSEDTLLLCWPEFGAEWPTEAIELFDGERLIYVGEPRGGSTGTGEMHRCISREFGVADEVIDIPQWEVANDRMYVFSR